MKRMLSLALLSLTASVFAGDLKLKDYDWWTVTDIASRGHTKEKLFSEMDRKFIKVKKSICSNRALMWNNDFKEKHNLDTAKIFIFYTKADKPPVFAKVWWYHVAPVVNEKGNLFVMDPAFPGKTRSPHTINEWFRQVSTFNNCREIQAHETELIDLMWTETTFPKETSYGRNDCYYKIVPHTIWNPRVLAQNLSGKDGDGKPVRVERSEINKNELMQACVEATSTKIGYALGTTKKQCTEYVNK